MDISPNVRNTQDTIHRYLKLQKKEDQSVDTSVLLRRGNEILTGGYMETKYGSETEGKAIQRLPYLGIHPICSYQAFVIQGSAS